LVPLPPLLTLLLELASASRIRINPFYCILQAVLQAALQLQQLLPSCGTCLL
jgi:hypothetical protein